MKEVYLSFSSHTKSSETKTHFKKERKLKPRQLRLHFCVFFLCLHFHQTNRLPLVSSAFKAHLAHREVDDYGKYRVEVVQVEL